MEHEEFTHTLDGIARFFDHNRQVGHTKAAVAACKGTGATLITVDMKTASTFKDRHEIKVMPMNGIGRLPNGTIVIFDNFTIQQICYGAARIIESLSQENGRMKAKLERIKQTVI